MKIVLILGTARKNNESRKVSNFLLQKIETLHHVPVDYLDLSIMEFPVMRERYSEGIGIKNLKEWVEKISAAAGVIIVAPEYKNGYPGALKNFLDYLPSGIFKYKAVGISSVTSGSLGASNSLSQLRLVSISMGGIVIPDRFQVSNVKEVFNHNNGADMDKLNRTSEKFLSEFFKYVRVLKELEQ